MRHRGVTGTLTKVLRYGGLFVTPAGWRERRFDSSFGVSTSGRIDRWELGVSGPTLLNAVEYRPTPVDDFIRLLTSLGIDYRDWVFIDLGAGKGRAVLLASHFSFKRIIGVEFSPGLTRVATANIARYRNPKQQCRQITMVCQDACAYAFPLEPLVLYLNNPFDGPVIEMFINNLRESLLKCPRDVYIVYWNPFCAPLFDRAFFLARIRRTGQYCVYRSQAFLPT